MSFATPIALIFLLIIPYIVYTGWPRHRFRRTRDITSLILRVTIVLLLVFALAGIQIVQAVDKLAVVFLVDVSDSMGVALQEQQMEFIAEAVAGKPVDDEWAIIAFAEKPNPQTDFSSRSEIGAINPTLAGNHTNLEQAIQAAISIFPANATRRIVILSDGQETQGAAEAKAQLAAASGIEISYVYIAREPSPDVLITDLDVPGRVVEGQEFDINVTVEAQEEADTLLRIFANGAMIYSDTIHVLPGTNNFSLTQTSTVSGFLDFQAQIVPESADNFHQNNALSAFTQVIGPPRVLIVSRANTDVEYLTPALRDLGVEVDSIRPENLPLSTAPLLSYKSVIIVNVPAASISTGQQEAIDAYVKDLGGGLVFVGGPDSYGPGGYFQRPLADTLPVEMQIKDQQRLPQLTIAYLIDSSGSMAAIGSSGVPNLELAKEAIIRSIEFLQPSDRAAVATFDTGGSWVAPFQDILDRRGVQRQVATLRPGGGTDILAGLRLVARDIVNEPSERKHIILLTDGGASPTNLIETTESLYQDHGVTLSVIAMGQGAAGFLQDMATAGDGNYHRVTNIDEIPTIFTMETVLATRSYIMEETFAPLLNANSPIISGISELPSLQGYVATTGKSTAQVILTGPEPYKDPLLASWQYGLGRAVAFTSDATARWAGNWVQWDGFPRFWGQAVNWSITEGADTNLETRIAMVGDRARIIVDARTLDGAFMNGLSLQTSLVAPNGDARLIDLDQVAPGRYEASFVPTDEGAYLLAITGGGIIDNQQTAFNELNGWVLSYSPEYNLNTDVNDTLLEKLAEITGGQSLSDAPTSAFAHTLDARTASAPIWPWLLIAAMILLPVDIAVRRLIITRSDLRRAYAFIFGTGSVSEEMTERLSSLMAARERGRQRAEEQASASGTISALRTSRTDRAESSKPTETPATPVQQGPRYAPSRTNTAQQQPPKGEDGNIGARLLKRRKGRDDEDE